MKSEKELKNDKQKKYGTMRTKSSANTNNVPGVAPTPKGSSRPQTATVAQTPRGASTATVGQTPRGTQSMRNPTKKLEKAHGKEKVPQFHCTPSDQTDAHRIGSRYWGA